MIRLIVLLLCTLLASSALADETRRFNSRHYDITTDLPPELAQELSEHMDAVHDEYARRFRAFGKRNAEPLRLWVFNTQRGYQTFLATLQINSTGSAGMFFRTSDASGLAAFLEPRPMEDMLETLRHEGMHQFLYQRIGDDLPPWINEGMAEWFGYALRTERGFEMGLADPRAIDRLHARLESDTLVPLPELLAMTPREWNERVRDGSHAGQYDASWSVIHFLAFAENGRYASLLDQLLRRLWQGMDAQRAIDQTFGGDIQGLGERWREYVDQLGPDELYLASDVLAAYAELLSALHAIDVTISDPESLDRALIEHADRLKLPDQVWTSAGDRPLDTDADAWWRTLPDAARSGRASTLRMIVDRRGRTPPEVEIRGLKRRIKLEWNLNRAGELSHEIAIR